MVDKLNALGEKYKIKEWKLVDKPTFEDSDGKIWIVETYRDIEDLFKKGEGKVVCVYSVSKDIDTSPYNIATWSRGVVIS